MTLLSTVEASGVCFIRCLAHLCLGLTRIDLSSLENLRSIWVVIIGLELLSLACPCLGLGRNYATSFILVAPYHDYGYFLSY
jgi:hypothetical protein